MKGATPRTRTVTKSRSPRSSASRTRTTRRLSLRTYCRDHARGLVSSIGDMYRNPVANLMTVLVIGIALALPATLLVILDNLQRVAGGWQGGTSISIYLKPSVGDPEPLRLELHGWREIATAEAISRQQALEEFRQLSGFGNALDTLQDNPLPNVVVVTPASAHAKPEAVEALVQRLSKLPQVDLAQLDLEWLKRLSAIMELGRRVVLAIGVLLGLGALLIVGNTIRLDIQNRRDEIEVTKLVGGTDAFIRRPFLYMGCWHGLLGAIVAWLLLNLAVWQLGGPVRRLSGLYASDFQLQSVGADDGLLLLMAGVGLGLIGSWLAVGRHLGAIEPV